MILLHPLPDHLPMTRTRPSWILFLKKSFTEHPARPEEAQAHAQAQEEAQAQEDTQAQAQEDAQEDAQEERWEEPPLRWLLPPECREPPEDRTGTLITLTWM